jgi:predicted dinucleotide-binding enzyme
VKEETMNIGIIGAGNVGGTLGRAWAARGHQVTFGVRDVQSLKVPALLDEIGLNVQVGSVAEAAAFGEVVVLAVPWPAAQDAVQAAGDLTGKVLVDCVNPIAPGFTGLSIGHTTSAAEEIARAAPGAKVVKAFNTTGSGNMADPRYGSEQASMFYCGDDAGAKAVLKGLGEEIGFDMVDAGPLANARLLEPLALLWITLAYAQGMGPNIAFKLLRR